MTISEAMVLTKTIRERINSLTVLRNANAIERNTYFMSEEGETKKRDELTPKYDPKSLDQSIVGLENTLFKIDVAIKRANAKTDIGVEVDINQIIVPIV